MINKPWEDIYVNTPMELEIFMKTKGIALGAKYHLHITFNNTILNIDRTKDRLFTCERCHQEISIGPITESQRPKNWEKNLCSHCNRKKYGDKWNKFNNGTGDGISSEGN